jgi:hypothetical protein
MLKALKLSNSTETFAISIFCFLAILFPVSCGKRKPPLPPKERVVQRVVIEGVQRGNLIILSWTMPARNVPDGSALNIDRVDIYRLAEPLSTPLSLTEEEFSSRSTLITSKKISDDDFALKKITVSDPLEFAGQTARLIYAIRFVNSSGQKAAFSNFLLVEPTARVADKPNNLKAEITQTTIKLEWNSPESNVDKSKPVNVLGYNIYRKTKNSELTIKLNESPIDKNNYVDETFQFGKEYEYFVRAVSIGGEGEPIESLDSNNVSLKPVDIFPPSPPSAITIAAAPNNLSIFFATNPEKDIAGYTLYRSEERNLPLKEWKILTPDLLKTNTFQDKNVESGKIYYYYLTATDLSGNVSESSEIFSETVP